MSPFVYNVITVTLVIAIFIAAVVGLISLVAVFIRWRSPQRRGHVIRLFAALVAIPAFIGIQQAMLWWVFLPSFGREQMAKIEEARATRLAESSYVRIGDAAPPFTLTTADGEEFVQPQRGTVVLINFFATWCGPCALELPHIEKIWTAHKDDERFRLVVIGREESDAVVLQYRRENGYTFPIAADPERKVYSLFAKELIPRTLVISPDGRVVYSQAGFNEAELEKLQEVLREQLARGLVTKAE
jgi:peroxiredoxin